MNPLIQRKDDHLRICAEENVGFRSRTTLFQEVELFHDAMPEVSYDHLDLRVDIFGKSLEAPLIIASMSGGTPEAASFNRALARVAQKYGIGLALGSQSAMLASKPRFDGFLLRDEAPGTLLLGNLGLVRARELSADLLEKVLIEPCGLDALCLHLNPAQELIQPEGDRDFRGCEEALERLVSSLKCPLIVKETGCGLSRALGFRLVNKKIRWVDISGAGGTSWVGVETLRADIEAASLGESFWDWGIPTAASLCQLSGLPLKIIATGGIASGLDVAKAIVLGAQVVGVARPLLKAFAKGGEREIERSIEQLIRGLRMAMVLCGAATLEDLRQLPWMPGPVLRRWMVPDTSVEQRAFLGI